VSIELDVTRMSYTSPTHAACTSLFSGWVPAPPTHAVVGAQTAACTVQQPRGRFRIVVVALTSGLSRCFGCPSSHSCHRVSGNQKGTLEETGGGRRTGRGGGMCKS
jgi:hypothetical protein